MPSHLHCFLCGNLIQEIDECCGKCGWTWSGHHAESYATRDLDDPPFDDEVFTQRFGFSMQSIRSKGKDEGLFEFVKYINAYLQESGLEDEGEREFALMYFLGRNKYAKGQDLHQISDKVFGDHNERRRRRRDPYWNS